MSPTSSAIARSQQRPPKPAAEDRNIQQLSAALTTGLKQRPPKPAAEDRNGVQQDGEVDQRDAGSGRLSRRPRIATRAVSVRTPPTGWQRPPRPAAEDRSFREEIGWALRILAAAA